MILDNDMLSVMLAAGDTTMQVKLKQDIQTWTKAGGKDGNGNKGIIVKSGTIHNVLNESNGWIAIDVSNRWIPYNPTTCETVGEVPDEPPPADTGKYLKLIITRVNLPPLEFDLTEVK